MSEPHPVLDVAPTISDAVVGWLEGAGPQLLSGVTGRLSAEGLLDDSLLREFMLSGIAGGQGAELEQDALAGFVLDDFGYDDRVWATGHDDDSWLASTDARRPTPARDTESPKGTSAGMRGMPGCQKVCPRTRRSRAPSSMTHASRASSVARSLTTQL
jgi:hypothetical protein